jgi:hypothetical protein
MNYENLNKMGSWERRKAMFLLETAESLGMNTNSYGKLGVNQNSRYTYLWLEDYNFTLYVPINCDLTRSDVWILHTNIYDGEETKTTLDNMTLKDIYSWVDSIEKEEEEEEEEEV